MDVGLKNSRKYLPDEQLYLIFAKLDSIRDRESFGLSCHHFLDIQNSSLKCLDLERNPRIDIDSNMLARLLNRFRKLESLILTGCIDVEDEGLIPLQNYGTNLHSINLDFCTSITDEGLFVVAASCPLLSVISLYCCVLIKDKGLEVLTESCKLLKEVNAGDCDISDGGIVSLIKNCRQLRALKISFCDNILGTCFDWNYNPSFEGCPPTLACLEGEGCNLIPKGISGILTGGGLEYLNLAYLNTCVRPHGLTEIGSGSAPNLKVLNLKGCSMIEDDTIMKISKGCPLLQEWDLSYCKKIDSPGWESIGLNCENLVTIHVNGCLKLGDNGLLAVGNGCKRLKVVYMTECKLITQSGITSFKAQRQDVEVIREERSIVPSWAFPSWKSWNM